MKVALVGMESEFDSADSTSGINKYMHQLYSEIKKIPGIEVDKFEYSKIARKLPWANHSVFYLESKFTNFKEYDIIHNPNGIRLFAKPEGSRLVTTIHDLMPVTNRSKSTGNGLIDRLVVMNSQLSDYVATQGFRLALKSDHIVVDIEYGKEELLKYFKYDKDKITTIRLAIDQKFITEPIEPRTTEVNKFRIGYLGSFNATKNIAFAVRAVKMIKEQDVKFELWGEKTVEAGLLDREIGSDGRIQFMGLQEQKDKIRIFDSFDVFVHPGVYESIIQFEALSRGLPVIIWRGAKITADLRAYCFEVDDEKQMAECILNIKKNGYDKQKRKEAMKFARQFTWKNVAESNVKVYRKVLNE
ncbi:MAG: glycosyltransferase family 4 protein [Candidatus Micrarchaeota archaeon]|nr:glycosyltransferase family 4 protein [Candidatus Micrarchaeota archaeon]